MEGLILHHYDMSPYSEKVRAMLGYLGASWQSAITKEMPPRPDVELLAGGYRRIPIAQVGADIYCDTKTITTLLANQYNKPELAIENADQAIRDFVKETEGDLFFASVMYGASMKLNKKVIKRMSLLEIAKFMIDRVNMGRKAKIQMISPGQAPGIVKAFLPRFEAQLSTDYIFGDQPTIADFALYHCLWFIRDLGERPILNKYPKTLDWLDRIKAFGIGNPTEITTRQAIEIARTSTPIDISEQYTSDENIGKAVAIEPNDYGTTATSGVLQGVTESEWIIARESNETGLVHVHFPKQGFELTAV